jgi:hypothetical protein
MRRRLIPVLSAALVVFALAAASSPAARSGSAIARARNLLRGHVYIRFTESGVLGNSLDQRLHLCSNGKFVYDTVSNLPEPGTTTTNRVRGRWRVLAAHFARRGLVASARVKGTPDDGSAPLTVRFARTARGRITIDGAAVSVGRSDLCS